MSRTLRVRKATTPTAAGAVTPSRPATPVPKTLASDSLGWSLVLAARVLAEVQGKGRSLNDALLLLADQPPHARAAAQDVAYGVLRRYGCGEFILGRLMSKPLTHKETLALLLGALYRLETRSDSTPMIVDQAVAAAGELAGDVFKRLVNGVLRNYLRQRDALLAAMALDEEASHQHPRWWLARLRRAYRDQWPSIVAAGNASPPMTLRVNQRRITVPDYRARLDAAGILTRPVGRHGFAAARALGGCCLAGLWRWIGLGPGCRRPTCRRIARSGARFTCS
ncbi:transcription antitermination factor NusB [Propionivibrio sp.]|uniref:transcription antitermination factor NusB n=1 Tax=Propionivibrio sp. TaxID=2212460 RepID=UPI00345CEDBF